MVFGVLGFAIGFLGPLLITPNANQGPLIGIFYTGPYGALAGGIIGGLVYMRRSRKHGGKDT